MVKKIIFAIVSLSITLISGCSYYNQKLGDKISQPTQSEITCSNLKRQIIFERSDSNVSGQDDSPAQKARLTKMYEKYNCDAQLKENQ